MRHALEVSNGSWAVSCGGTVLHEDSPGHVALILRVLGIEEQIWRRMMNGYAARWTSACSDLGERAKVLAQCFAACSPHLAMPAAQPSGACPICGSSSLHAAYARTTGPTGETLEYGRCLACGHGRLYHGQAAKNVYAGSSYFTERRADGAGYCGYESEQTYRERKARLLLGWACQRSDLHGRRLLEVGSGLGFARRAAEDRGMVTEGVDPNPYAAQRARLLYGMETHAGTLAEARRRGDLSHLFDLVLYQFVLEHVDDPGFELREAAPLLEANGRLVIVVPSMDALEIQVFGGCYRSFRADHLHVFSRESLRRLLAQEGFRVVAEKTECSVHLLGGFYSAGELETIYARGEGPDLFVVAQKEPS
jgi:SAM-dependent methyltransferase